jgi:hypothetical protein
MAATIFLGAIEPILKNDGTVNQSGTIEFYSPNTAFAIPKAVYADADLTTSLGSIVTLNAAGTIYCFQDGNYDIKIKDSDGGLIRSVQNISPEAALLSPIPNILANGGFESGDLSSWTLFEFGSGPTTVDAVDQREGTYSLKFTSIGLGGGHVTSQLFAVSTQREIQVGFSLRSSLAACRNTAEVRWFDVDKNFISATTIYDDSSTNPTSWGSFQYIVVPIASAYWASVRLTGCDPSVVVAATTRFDDVKVFNNTTRQTMLAANNTWTGNNTYQGKSTFTGPLQGAIPLIFEGATEDNFETSVAVTDPTADRTVTIPDATGTVGLTASASVAATGTSTTECPTIATLTDHDAVPKYIGRLTDLASSPPTESNIVNRLGTITPSRNAQGDHTISWVNALNNLVVQLTTESNTTANARFISVRNGASTTALRLLSEDAGATLQDVTTIYITIWGELA